MKILFSAEENFGGGAISNYNLAIAATSFANVAFFGIDYKFIEDTKITYFSSNSKRAISIRYIYSYWDAINKYVPDIIHGTGMYTSLIAIVFRFLFRKRYKIIMTLRHSITRFRFDFIAKRFVRYLNNVDCVHYLTEYQRKVYWNIGLKPKKYYIISNIIIPERFNIQEVNNLSKRLLHETNSDNLIVYVGRLIKSKQIELFIKTIKLLNKEKLNVGGVIVGGGEDDYVTTLKDLSKKLEIDDKIIFTGFTKDPILYIKACDFSLFPTLSEALPRFIIETFSQQKTIVVSNHPSIADIVNDDFDSLVVKADNPEEYAVNCKLLIKNPQLLKKLESGAKFTYNKYYKYESLIKDYKCMYFEWP